MWILGGRKAPPGRPGRALPPGLVELRTGRGPGQPPYGLLHAPGEPNVLGAHQGLEAF